MIHIIGTFKDGKGRDYWINKQHSNDSLLRTLTIESENFKTSNKAQKFINTFNNTSIRSNEVTLRIEEHLMYKCNYCDYKQEDFEVYGDCWSCDSCKKYNDLPDENIQSKLEKEV